MSKDDYQDGFGEGINYAKDVILEWVDTFEGEDFERLQIMRDRLIEVLESPGLDFS